MNVAATRHTFRLLHTTQSSALNKFRISSSIYQLSAARSIFSFPSFSAPSTKDSSSSTTPTAATAPAMASATTFFDFTPKDKKASPYPLSQHKGKVILAVNTASKCGFTPQFEGLESLYKSITKQYPDDFVILGFPCNQFGGQDPGSNDDIQSFCQVNYGVSFPVLGKTNVNGDDAEPVFEWMKTEKPGLMGLKRVKWNFEKFLIGRDGKVVGRWASTSKPEGLQKEILAEIAKGGAKPAAAPEAAKAEL